MLKRKCPFNSYNPRQLKTHVGFKETATNDELKEVYDRTRTIMFEGANPTKVVSNAAILSPCNGAVKEIREPLKKQQICYYCRNICAVTSKCWFCERSVCSSCLGTCVRCKLTCCTLCSVMNYDKTEVRFFCLDCVT